MGFVTLKKQNKKKTTTPPPPPPFGRFLLQNFPFPVMQISQNKLYHVISFTFKWLHFYHSNTFKWGVVHSRVFTQTVLLAWTDQPRHLSLKPLETNHHHRGQTTRADVSANRQNVTHQVTISLIYILCMYTHSGWCSDVPREAKVTQQNIYTHTSHCGSLQ